MQRPFRHHSQPLSLAFIFIALTACGDGDSGANDRANAKGGNGGAAEETANSGGKGASTNGNSTGGNAGGASGGTSGGPTTSTFVFPATPDPWTPSEACVDAVKTRLASMTLAEKAGQMVQGDSANATTAAVNTYKLGSILSGGGSDPSSGDTVSAWVSHVQGYVSQGVSMGTPILYGIDAVHGHNNVTGAVIFPHNIGLGCTRNADLVEEIGRITAEEVRGTGIHWTFAPVVAAGRDERWGRTYETYAETPELAAELGVALIRGLQGKSLRAPNSVLACAKHFAGDGATNNGVDQGNSLLDADSFKANAIDQYQPAINAGVGSIMVSFSSFQGTKMSANQRLLTDTLKGTMGFRGFLISDWAAVQQLGRESGFMPAPTRAALATAINAGLDMIMEPNDPAQVAKYISEAPAQTGTAQIPVSRIDDAVTRILQIKCELGLLDSDYTWTVDPSLTAQIGSDEHRAVARRAVRESLVLLKNEGVLPLSKTSKLLVAGSAADNKAKQCGGWTIDWMGIGTKGAGGENPEPGDTQVTTILQGIRDAAGANNVTFSADGTPTATGFTHAIVVVGEDPYAEGEGDRTNLSLGSVSPTDVTAINNVTALNLPTVVVIVSGRPLIVTDLLPKAGAWLAAWLPGTEGNGVSDVLFGDYAPTGRLSHSWPKSMAQIPINVGDADYSSDPPQFTYGFGLSY
ncbi:MAG: glycoside hydrolase family 3 N-terminal domain-containing protein [Polyangiaceae bacterium]